MTVTFQRSTCRQTVFRAAFDLQPREAAMLDTLFAAQGGPVTAAELIRQAGIGEHTVATRILCLRGSLGSCAVETVRGAGYRLTGAGDAKCRAALAAMVDGLLAAA